MGKKMRVDKLLSNVGVASSSGIKKILQTRYDICKWESYK